MNIDSIINILILFIVSFIGYTVSMINNSIRENKNDIATNTKSILIHVTDHQAHCKGIIHA